MFFFYLTHFLFFSRLSVWCSKLLEEGMQIHSPTDPPPSRRPISRRDPSELDHFSLYWCLFDTAEDDEATLLPTAATIDWSLSQIMAALMKQGIPPADMTAAIEVAVGKEILVSRGDYYTFGLTEMGLERYASMRKRH